MTQRRDAPAALDVPASGPGCSRERPIRPDVRPVQPKVVTERAGPRNLRPSGRARSSQSFIHRDLWEGGSLA